MSRVKLFTHNDLDGMGCAILAKLAFENNSELEVEYCSYDNINDKVKEFITNTCLTEYRNVFITDISVNEEVAKIIDDVSENFKIFKLLDHHKTAGYLNLYEWATVKSEIKFNDSDDDLGNDYEFRSLVKENDIYYYRYSGTSLFYEYLKDRFSYCANKVIKYFVELVRQYDTWTWTYTKNQEAKNLSDVFGILGIDDFVSEYTEIIRFQITERQFKFSIAEEHLILLKYKRKDIDDYINYKMSKVTEYLSVYGKVGIVLCDRKDCTSELGDKMCNELDIEYAALIYDDGVALRSIGDFDVSVIAKANEGGGHKNAAGFSFDTIGNIIHLDEVLKIIL